MELDISAGRCVATQIFFFHFLDRIWECGCLDLRDIFTVLTDLCKQRSFTWMGYHIPN